MLERLWSLVDGWLWSERAAGFAPLAVALRVLRYPYAVLRDLSRGELNLRAMGLVYTTLLSLVPLLAFSFAILKAFGAHRELEPIVYEFFRPVGSAAAELTARVMQFVDGVSSGLVGSVGFALLLWTLIGTIRKVEDSFNFLWRVDQPRSFARRVAEYVGLVIIGPLLLVAFIGLAHAALDSAPVQQISQLAGGQGMLRGMLEVAPYVMVCAIFTGLYLFVPNTAVRLGPALVGGVTAGVLWAAVGKLFTALVVLSSRLTIVYAGFAVVVAALLWTYFGWLILLIGARLAYYLQNPAELRQGLAELRLSSAEVETLSLQTMYLVGESHARGSPGWSIDALAQRLAVPGLAVAQTVAALERAGLLVATDREQLIPARDIGRIPLAEILEVARNQRSGHATILSAVLAPVSRLTRVLDESRRERCAGRTLRDLLEETPA
jgi:membrane protein